MEEQFRIGDIVRLEKGSVFVPISEGKKAKIINIDDDKYSFEVLDGKARGCEQIYYRGLNEPLPFHKVWKWPWE